MDLIYSYMSVDIHKHACTVINILWIISFSVISQMLCILQKQIEKMWVDEYDGFIFLYR